MGQQRTTTKEKNMIDFLKKFKDFISTGKEVEIKESIIDIPRRIYAPGVFDDADTENPKLKQEVLDIINTQLKEFEKLAPVVRYSLIGSILTKRYRNDADLDINVLFDVPKDEQEAKRLEWSKKLKDINGKNIPGTEHPVNYYVMTDPEVERKNNEMADGVFDIENNTWERKPEPDTFEPEKYEADFQKKVRELDVIKGELKRDLIDYDELSNLTNNDVLNLQDRVNKKLEEIEDSIRRFKEIGDTLTTDRRDAFATDMTPDEIREYGKKNKLPKNVIYKMLEKYHYLKFYKKLKEILEDDKIDDKEIADLQKHEELELKEAVNKTLVLTFGRFNPPTIGHEKLIKKVASTPGDIRHIYLSKSQDVQKNPLTVTQKIKFMRDMFPQYKNMFRIPSSNMVLDIMVQEYKKGFENITMVVGSDRVREFETLIKRYNGVKMRSGFYDFKNIKVISAGERDPDAEGASGMSASKMRAAVKNDDFETFAKGLPPSYKGAQELFKAVATGMRVSYNRKKLAASVNHHMGYNFKPIASLEEFEQNQIRDMYIREMIFNLNDKVNYVKEDVQGVVKRRGTNYIVIEDNNNNLHKCWIWDCVPVSSNREIEMREYDLNVDYGFEAVNEKTDDGHTKNIEQDRDVKKKKGTQPKKYYKGLSKDVKDKRADHFKSQDTTKPGYKPAPGDDKAKTKPSKHTQKYKKMFGEFKKDLKDACWSGYKQVGMKTKNGKQVPNCVPESYEIGQDYANHTKEVTPGETPTEKPVDSKLRTPENTINKDSRKDKYKMKTFKEYAEDDIYAHLDEELEITEAEYQGKKVKLNDPIRGGSKKFYVYVKNDKGNVVKVSFGDTTGLSIKRDDPERRKSFRARHKCDTAKDKTTARYWSCRMWTAKTKVSDLD
jgi:nicotinamide mononucleotide adenylyltransferase/predicted nucleotidyltransferase